MAASEALQLALALHVQPFLAGHLRSRPLPSGVIDVLRLASGHSASVAAAMDATGMSAAALREACRFFVEQQLLSRECGDDPWRVLGVPAGAEAELIREHRRLLVGLVHPDRGEDWATAFSDRVNRAWRQLKTPEGRREAFSPIGGGPAVKASAGDFSDDGFGGNSAGTKRNHADYSHAADDAWAYTAASGTGTDNWTSPVVQPLVQREIGASAATGRHLATVLGVLTLIVVATVGWNLLGNERQGEDLLVPMGEEAARISAKNPPRALITQPAQISQAAGASALPMTTATASVVAEAQGVDTLPILDNPRAFDLPAHSEDKLHRPSAEATDLDSVADVDLLEPELGGPKVLEANPIGLQQSSVSAATPKSLVHEPITQRGRSKASEPLGTVNATRQSARTVEIAAIVLNEGEASSAPGSVPEDATVAMSLSGRYGAVLDDKSDVSEPSLGVGSRDFQVSDSAQTKLSGTDVQAFLDTFSLHYANGDLSALIGLFSSRANSAKGGSIALAADYARLFDSTRERDIAIRGLTWRRQDDSLRGEGRFEARYYRKGGLFRQVVRGQITFVIVEEHGALRLLRLDSRPGDGA